VVVAAITLTVLPAVASCGSETQQSQTVAERAAEYRADLRPREHLGTIRLSPSSAPMVVRAGADQAGVDRGGAAWDERTALPGEGRPISVAGHRTTHGAPFEQLGTLKPGDEVTFELPYATATYEVVRSRLVSERNLSALTRGESEELRLFASTIPPGSKRLFVYAKPSDIEPDR
jgi:sortase A